MRRALISPKGRVISDDPEFREFWRDCRVAENHRRYWAGIGTGLLVIAALTPDTYEIDLIDENVEALDFSKAYDLVGITAMTQQAPRAYEIADEFRKRGIKK